MKTLTLVRHAKSSWKEFAILDIDRPLNRRGKRDAPEMGRRMLEQGTDPELIVSSPAKRALDTAEAIAEEIEYPVYDIAIDDRLYHAEVSDWLAVIRDIDDYLSWVMCVGHNPGLTELATYLGYVAIDNVPTCGVVELTFDADSWSLLGEIEPTDVTFDYPKRRDT